MENNYVLDIAPLAAIDLEEAFRYISEELQNPDAAFALINEIDKALDKVCLFPESFPLIQNKYVKDKTVRKLPVKNYIVFYKVHENTVQVVRVIYGMRNYEDIL